MKKTLYIIFALLFAGTGCNDFLDRPNKDILDDDTYWESEKNLELFANGFYERYFQGYGTGWSGQGYTIFYNDYSISDVVSMSNQMQYDFPNTVPETATGIKGWLGIMQGVRKANIFIDRIENRAKPKLTEDVYAHWMGVARFFRGLEYARAIMIYGDFPYYDAPVPTDNPDLLFKNRDPRVYIADKIFDDFEYAINHCRSAKNWGYVEKYVIAAFASKYMLYEGTWQVYHDAVFGGGDSERAKKYLKASLNYADMVIQSGRYAIQTDLRTLFGSLDLSSNKEVILGREYIRSSVAHTVATYCNPRFDTQWYGAPNHKFISSVLCIDGKPQGTSDLINPQNFEEYALSNLLKKVDPRLGMSISDTLVNRGSYSSYYTRKFIPREGELNSGAAVWNGNNETSCPVMRYGEILLNYIEAKAELEKLGEATVTQSDIDLTINALRDRPIDETGISQGLVPLAHLNLNAIPIDNKRDADVSPLIWEIRRERMIELFYECTRADDVKRWKKIEYFNNDLYPETLWGAYMDLSRRETGRYLVIFSNAATGEINLTATQANIYGIYDGTETYEVFSKSMDPADQKGFRLISRTSRLEVKPERAYLSPIPKSQIDLYADNSYELRQNPGW
ncbi:MAG: RagB/SusD family nutrient uptake outer membrane protein [Bacteroidetes bacterium]|nr:RagB/SusD family nutrient uptake outer membrane protein [Bacteroidota bacterium]